ncbi:glycine receptor subunit alpha 1 [Echinococcus multilocularis]|uniref:Glycine receptor subunit alpha 1 n=1 Tax=Echinococcus multilocularis TaxID=6211 RepID=A0A068YAE9_ECHMU|nr:glycine receptor subunit alpha 1 [Echinococcus multilocularis]
MPQKRREVGWMYHAMEKPFSDPKPVPPLSSIPLIGLHPEDSKEHVQKRPFSKLLSTDTPLIRLQKLGGRKDLLCFYKNEPHKDSNEVPSECVPSSPQDSKLPCSEYQIKVPTSIHHSACILKSPTLSTPKIVDTPCLPLSTKGRPRQRKNKPWNLSPRLGYSEYNKTVPPLSFIRREYFYPSTSRYIRPIVTLTEVTYPIPVEVTEPVEYNVYESRESSVFAAKPRLFKSQRDEIMATIFKNYKTHERPTELLNESTVVKVNMKILAIFSVDVRNMDYYVDALLRQTWVDPRLMWEHLPEHASYTMPIVSPNLKDQVWLPDLFFRNGKDGYLHKMTLPNYLLRVYPNGKVLYSQKITMRFACQMELQNFPMDEQVCDINIGSYGYTFQELRFDWTDQNALELTKDLQISEFYTPANFTTIDCTEEASTSTGNYTCLLVKFHLSRQLGSYLVTTYIPNALIIMVSWVSFWVPADAAPARVPLGLLCLQGLCTQAVSISSSLPRVSYTKAIDVWLICSIIFVVSVMAEYAVALTVMNHEKLISWRVGVRRIVREELARWWKDVYHMEISSSASRAALVTKRQAEMFAHVEAVLTHQGDLRPPNQTRKMLGEHNLPSQPDSLAELLTHKYAEEDYRMQKKFWNDYLSQLKDINCCQPRPVEVITSRFSPIPKRC